MNEFYFNFFTGFLNPLLNRGERNIKSFSNGVNRIAVNKKSNILFFNITRSEFVFSIGSKTTEALFTQVSLLTPLFAVFNDKMGATFRALEVCLLNLPLVPLFILPYSSIRLTSWNLKCLKFDYKIILHFSLVNILDRLAISSNKEKSKLTFHSSLS